MLQNVSVIHYKPDTSGLLAQVGSSTTPIAATKCHTGASSRQIRPEAPGAVGEGAAAP